MEYFSTSILTDESVLPYAPDTEVVAYENLGGITVVMDNRDYVIGHSPDTPYFADMMMRELHHQVSPHIANHVKVFGEIVKDKDKDKHPSCPAVFIVHGVVERNIVLPWNHVTAYACDLGLAHAAVFGQCSHAGTVISETMDTVIERGSGFVVRPVDAYKLVDTVQLVSEYRPVT